MNKTADEGNVWVCLACGKMSRDHYGDQPISRGWDESCMMNSEELPKARLIMSDSGERVIGVKPPEAA